METLVCQPAEGHLALWASLLDCSAALWLADWTKLAIQHVDDPHHDY